MPAQSLISFDDVRRARSSRVLIGLGDSRIDQIHTDTLTKKVISNGNMVGWAKALSGQRMNIAYNGGVSGERSDQMLARLAPAMNTRAATAIIQAGLNDIAQAVTNFVSIDGPLAGSTITTATAALHAFTNIKFAVERLYRAGFEDFIIVLEPGATNLSAASVGQVIELNQRLRDWSEEMPGVHLFDLPFYLWNATAGGASIAFKTGYRRWLSGVADNDPSHYSSAGAYAAGIGLAKIFEQIATPLPRELRNINEVPSANSNINQIANPMFSVTTGGTNGAGSSGTAHGNWSAGRSTIPATISGAAQSTTQSVAISNGTPADGSPGKEAILACTFNAAGDAIRINQDWTAANWNAGDILQGGAEVSIDDCTGIAGVTLYLQCVYDTNKVVLTSDLYPIDVTQFGTGALKLSLLTEKITIPPLTTKNWVTQHLIVTASGAGTPTVRVRRMMGKRRFS